jgi:myxalamid-type polyketide synthase MxaB
MDEPGYLADHAFFGTSVFPAAGYVELALAAAEQVLGAGEAVVEEVSLDEALLLPVGERKTIQVVLTPEGEGVSSFRVYSPALGRGSGDGNDDGNDDGKGTDVKGTKWRTHASGQVKVLAGAGGEDSGGVTLEEAQERCREEVEVGGYYAGFEDREITYGPSFRGLDRIWRSGDEALGRLRLPEGVSGEGYRLHPVLLDACFQLMGAPVSMEEEWESGVFMPTGFKRLRVLAGVGLPEWAHVALERSVTREGSVVGHIRLYDESGREVGEVEGLLLQRISKDALVRGSQPRIEDWLYAVEWRREARLGSSATVGNPGAGQAGPWVVFTDAGGVGRGLGRVLEEGGEPVLWVEAGVEFEETEGGFRVDPKEPKDIERVVREAASRGPLRGCVHLWGLDAREPEGSDELSLEGIHQTQAMSCGSALALSQALTRVPGTPVRLWLVTRGAQAVGGDGRVSVAQTTLWGLGRTVAVEQPELRCVRVDLDPGWREAEEDGAAGKMVRERPEEDGAVVESARFREVAQTLALELVEDGTEDQVAYRGGERYVARLVRKSAASAVSSGSSSRESALGERESLQLQIPSRGVLDNLTLVRVPRRRPGPGEVEIRVEAAGLNFRDVLNVLGMYPGDPGPLGSECAGRVVEVGEGVRGLEAGDAVLAMAPASFSSYVTVGADFVARKPELLSMEESATIPIAFLTAHYGLDRLAGMSAGQRVLIHAAAGGVGMAAVQLALRAGATVFGTAGNDQKREYLKSLGVSHVMDSRSVLFAEQIEEITEGRGVDIVLNALSGDFIPKSLSVLARGGWFLEIGKRGIWNEAQVESFRPGVSYRAFDLGEMYQHDAGQVRSMLEELRAWFTDGSLRPLPRRVYALDHAADAFRFMAQAKHIGKVVLVQPAGAEAASVEVVSPAVRPPASIHADATYLVTGGLGGLGLAVSRGLVERGARSLVLVGRSAPTESARAVLGELESSGARVVVFQGDVASPGDVRRLLEEITASMLPLRGVIHAAGVLDDAPLVKQDWERFRKVMMPKVDGAWNLHVQTEATPLDFFVLFSSVASVLGSPGQANYASANAFLDGLAQVRRARNLAGTSINWGPWAEVGMAASQTERAQRRLQEQGFDAIAPADGLRALDAVLAAGPVQVAVMSVRWERFLSRSLDG